MILSYESADPPREVWDYFFGGAGTEVTMKKNRSDWDAVVLLPRVLRDVAKVDLSVSLLGARVPVPVVVAPMAFLSLLFPQGELVLARAAARHQLSFCLSTRSGVPLEEVARAWHQSCDEATSPTGPRPQLMLQLYVMRDMGITESLLSRAIAAGFDAVVVTVDVPYIGVRRRDRANQLVIPDEFLQANVKEELAQQSDDPLVSFGGGVSSAKYSRLAQNPSMTWETVSKLRDASASLPMVLKGVLDPADMALCGGMNIDGVVVSNHGGRQLDGVISTPRALHAMREVERLPKSLLVDGSIESGSDVLRALGLGAGAVMIGRYFARALAVSGESGLEEAMSLLVEEIRVGMALMGLDRLSDMGSQQIRVPGWF